MIAVATVASATRYTDSSTGIETEKLQVLTDCDRVADRQTDRQAGRQTDRQTDRQID